jgi:hypothetical protein
VAFRAKAVLRLCVIILLLTGCSHEVPASTQKPPDYPGAMGLAERELNANDRLLDIYKAMSFATSDSPESVLKFYQDALVQDGWELDAFQPDPNGLSFKWSSYEQPPAIYRFDVRARTGDGKKTEVEVELRYNPGS